MTMGQAAVSVVVFALATFYTRMLPFRLFSAGKLTPKYVAYLGEVLPFAVTGMLVVYCLKEVRPLAYPYAIPEVAAVLAVAGLYMWRKNTLLAIGAGTVLYMLLVQGLFS